MPPAFASTEAITSFTNDDIFGHSNYDLAGYQFSNSSAIDVDSLGMFVSGATLADSHEIGIYDLSGNLQFDATVSAGATPDASGFAWVDLDSAETLAAGQWFIGVLYNQGSADEMYDGYGSIQMADGLTFDAAQVYYSGSPIDPSNPSGNSVYTEGSPRDSFIGPNFTFTDASAIASTPEPGTLGMLVIGVAGVVLGSRRKRVKA